MAEIESLELQITSNAKGAKDGLDALITTLDTLKIKTQGGAGLTSVANQVSKMATAAGKLSGSEGAKLESLGKGLQALSNLGNLKLSSSIANQISAIGTAVASLGGVDLSKVGALATALQPLGTIEKSNLGSTLNQLKQIPDVMTNLSKVDMGAFKTKINEVTEAVKPLATEMQKVANGFSAFPAKIQKFLESSEKVPSRNKSSSKSFAELAAKVSAALYVFKRGASMVASWINKSNEYTENLNLFTVAMGKYAKSAMEYANTVSEAMGIDTSEWIRNQGIFMTLATGFGVVGDRAATMSEQLTQLGYDLSSYYNITVEEAMQKLKSGFSGELEPLRNLGYDLSQAKLEAIALSLGIDKTVSSMTQAEKSQLRYYAIMTQVTHAQGDMARTLNAPSNQLRVLKAQLSQAARALGNIFIPALNAVLPYCIAIVRVIRDIASSIASLFGFEVQEVDYSGIEAVAGSATEASDAIDDATGSAKKLKRTLLGIDELNVMTDNSNSGGSGGADASGGGGFDFELPKYTFLDEIEDKVGKIRKKLKPIQKIITKIIEILWEYKEFVLAGLGVAAIVKLWSTLKGLWVKIKGLQLVSTFMNGFSLIRASGGNVFQAIGGGINSVRASLTAMQKAAIVAVAGFIEFNVISNNVAELAKGCENAGAKIVEMGVVAAAAAGAMYVALGPTGLAIAAIVGVTAAVTGFAKAQSELRKELVDATFFDGVGVSLDSFKAKLEVLTEQFSTQNQQISEWRDAINANNESIDKAGLKIQTLTTTLGSTGVVTQAEIDEIKSQFDSLYSCVRDNMTLSEEAVMTALVGAMQRATPEIAEQIDLLIGEYQRYVRETQGRAEELKGLINGAYDELVGKQKDDPAYQAIMENINAWYSELGYLSGTMSDAGWQWQQTVTDFNNNEIDFGTSVEEVTTTLGEIATCGQTALGDLATARDTVLKEIDAQIAYAAEYGSLEEVQMLGDLRQNIENDYAAQEDAIKSELNTIFESIQEGMIGEISGTKDALEAEWDEMNWFEKWWNGDSEEKYVRAGLQDLQENIDEISKAIQGHMDDLETDGSVWASDAMSAIIDALFDTTRYHGRGGVKASTVQYATDLETAIKQVYTELEESGKKTSTASGEEITNGLADGIASSAAMGAVRGAAETVVEVADEAVREAADINSPSKLFATEGGHMIDGLIKGIKDKLTALKNALTSVVTSAFDTDDAWDHGYDYGESFVKGLVKAIKNASFPTIKGSVTTSGDSASISFRAYAGGGFPDAGQMFLAREAGPELVGTIGSRTAVANNDQIVEAVSKGVYQAVASAMGNSRGDQVVEAKVNDKVLFEVIVSQARRETVRTGYNPLLGGV